MTGLEVPIKRVWGLSTWDAVSAAILYEKSLNLKTISQGNLATLERII